MDEIGVIHGRFQVLHNDHLKYLLAGKSKCKRLIIGICNPDRMLTKFTLANPHRSEDVSNPLTYYEREECIRLSMKAAGVADSEFTIVPFPINYPELLLNYVPRDAVFYMTIYDEWGVEKYNLLNQRLGLRVKLIRNTTLANKGMSSSDIRAAIASGCEWKECVPESVYRYLIDNNLVHRIKSLINEGEKKEIL